MKQANELFNCIADYHVLPPWQSKKDLPIRASCCMGTDQISESENVICDLAGHSSL